MSKNLCHSGVRLGYEIYRVSKECQRELFDLRANGRAEQRPLNVIACGASGQNFVNLSQKCVGKFFALSAHLKQLVSFIEHHKLANNKEWRTVRRDQNGKES